MEAAATLIRWSWCSDTGHKVQQRLHVGGGTCSGCSLGESPAIVARFVAIALLTSSL